MTTTESIRSNLHRDAFESVEYSDGDFYVYIHFRNDTGEPFYVGKGKGDRAYQKGIRRSEWWRNIVDKAGYTVKVIDNFGPNEELAFSCEIKTIAVLREIGFELCNLTDGGEGISGWIRTYEYKQRMREIAIKNESHKWLVVRTGCDHPMWNKTHSDTTKRKMSEAKLGENHWNYGGTLSDEHKMALLNANLGSHKTVETKNKISQSKIGKNLGTEHHNFKGFSIGIQSCSIVIFNGPTDMKSRGFQPGHISSCINKKRSGHKGYYNWIRTDSPSDIYPLLESREFADEESLAHWEYFQANYF